jgi:hypothetical protein
LTGPGAGDYSRRMKESLTPLRINLAIIGILAAPNIVIIILQLRQQETPVGKIIFSLAIAALSALSAMILFFSAWQTPRLISTAPKFLKFAIFFRYTLLLLERIPPAFGGDFLSISLLLFWTGVSFYMVKTVDRHAAAAKSDA